MMVEANDSQHFYLDAHKNEILALVKYNHYIDAGDVKRWQYTDAYRRTLYLTEGEVYSSAIECAIVAGISRQRAFWRGIASIDQLVYLMRNHLVKQGMATQDDVPVFITKDLKRKSPIGLLCPAIDSIGITKENGYMLFDYSNAQYWTQVFPWLASAEDFDKFQDVMMALESIHDNAPYAEWATKIDEVRTGTYWNKTDVPTTPTPTMNTKPISQINDIVFAFSKKLRAITVGRVQGLKANIQGDVREVNYECILSTGTVLTLDESELFTNAELALAALEECVVDAKREIDDTGDSNE